MTNYVTGSPNYFAFEYAETFRSTKQYEGHERRNRKYTVRSGRCRCKASVMYHRMEGNKYSLREIGCLHEGWDKNSNLPV